MDWTIQTFLAPKQGEPREDCEDSIHPAPGNGAEGALAEEAAVSDGTATSFFSGLWARILTRRFAANPAAAFDSAWLDWLASAQQEWQAETKKLAEAKEASFYTKNDVLCRKPGAATFVGLVLDPPKPGGGIPWRALVLGDSCLFLLGRDGPRSMELTKAEEFSYMVKAAETYEIENPHLPWKFGSGPWGGEAELIDGDSIMLATDALSKWLLLRAEHGRPVWGTVLSLAAESDFETFIDNARRESDDPLDNDDVSLAILKIGSPHERYIGCRFEPKPRVEEPPRAPGAPLKASLPPGPAKAAQDTPWRKTPVRRLPRLFASRLRNQLARPGAPPLAGILAVALAFVLGLGIVLSRETGRARRSEAAVAALGREVAAKTGEIDRLGERLNGMETDEQMLRQQVAAKTEETAVLRVSLDRSESQGKTMTQGFAGIKTEIASLRANLEALQAENKTLAAKADKSEQQRAALAGQLAEQLKRAADLARDRDDEAAKAKMEIARLKADGESLRKDAADKEKQIKELRAQTAATLTPPPPEKARDAAAGHGAGTPVEGGGAGGPEKSAVSGTARL